MFENDKIYHFGNGWSAIIEKRHFGVFKFRIRDWQKFTIYEFETRSTEKIISELMNWERETLQNDGLPIMNRFGFNLDMPSDDVIRAGVIAGLENYDFMEDI